MFLSFTEVNMKSCPSSFRSLNDLCLPDFLSEHLWNLGESLDRDTGASAGKVSENFLCSQVFV